MRVNCDLRENGLMIHNWDPPFTTLYVGQRRVNFRELGILGQIGTLTLFPAKR